MKKEIKAKHCKRCGELKPLSLFPKDVSRGDGHKSGCKECASKINVLNSRLYAYTWKAVSKAQSDPRYGQEWVEFTSTDPIYREYEKIRARYPNICMLGRFCRVLGYPTTKKAGTNNSKFGSFSIYRVPLVVYKAIRGFVAKYSSYKEDVPLQSSSKDGEALERAKDTKKEYSAEEKVDILSRIGDYVQLKTEKEHLLRENDKLRNKLVDREKDVIHYQTEVSGLNENVVQFRDIQKGYEEKNRDLLVRLTEIKSECSEAYRVLDKMITKASAFALSFGMFIAGILFTFAFIHHFWI